MLHAGKQFADLQGEGDGQKSYSYVAGIRWPMIDDKDLGREPLYPVNDEEVSHQPSDRGVRPKVRLKACEKALCEL